MELINDERFLKVIKPVGKWIGTAQYKALLISKHIKTPKVQPALRINLLK